MTTVARPTMTTGALVARHAAGSYHRLTIAAPGIVGDASPGQFVSVGVDLPETLLRRPFAIAGVDRAAGLVDLVVADVGRGSAWLTTRPVSTTVDVVGPLGTAFIAPDGPSRCVLVGGGYGVAPLAWLAGRLTDAGHTVELLSGARTAAAVYPVEPRPDVHVTEVTEDGSRGRAGLVTEALADSVTGGRATVFACGPMPMLAVVAGMAARHGHPCQVAVEEHMGCSVGVCMTCVVPTNEGYVRACVDGPVLDAERVDWSAVSANARQDD